MGREGQGPRSKENARAAHLGAESIELGGGWTGEPGSHAGSWSAQLAGTGQGPLCLGGSSPDAHPLSLCHHLHQSPGGSAQTTGSPGRI